MAGGRRVLIAASVVAGAAWGVIHASAPAVRAWKPLRWPRAKLGRLNVTDALADASD